MSSQFRTRLEDQAGQLQTSWVLEIGNLERGEVVLSTKVLFRLHMSLVVRKPVFGVSDQVRHKSGCTATENG